uniref:Uncharacterized protein n=1 Tax=Romanomermis culicivorax TaxID=13658 RepID=A0A915HMH6_ROMCU
MSSKKGSGRECSTIFSGHRDCLSFQICRKFIRLLGVAFILHGTPTATAAMTNQTAPKKTNVEYDWLHVTCTEIRLVTATVTVAVP